MIKLDLPLKVCNECPNFKPDILTNEFWCGNNKKANHTIKCENGKLCKALVEFLTEEEKKDGETV